MTRLDPNDAARPLAVVVRGLTWQPLGRRQPTLREVCVALEPGERLLVVGPSGAGKSTLLRALAGLLETADAGQVTGDVVVGGSVITGSAVTGPAVTGLVSTGSVSTAASPAQPADGTGSPVIGLVLQEPGRSVVASTVGRDVAFGPENLGLPRAAIAARVESALAAVGFPYGPRRPTSALSGGELQLLAVAGSLAMRPGLLLLDEPVSMLDAPSAAAVVDAVRSLGRGSTLVVVDHRPSHWLDIVDQMLVLDETGSVVADGPVRRVLDEQRDLLRRLGVWLPGDRPERLSHPDPRLAPGARDPSAPVLSLRDVVVHRRGHGPLPSRRAGSSQPAVDDVSLDLRLGEPAALVGPPGAGKSTLLAVAAGLLAPTTGHAQLIPASQGRPLWRWSSPELARHVAWIPQRPDQGFVTARVRDEVLATPRAVRGARRPGGPDQPEQLPAPGALPAPAALPAPTALSAPAALSAPVMTPAQADALLERLGLGALADADPRSLSGGEARRLGVAAALAAGPLLVCADEPTVGLDRNAWDAVTALLAEHAARGLLLLATHDEDLVATVASRRVDVRGGRVVADRRLPA